MADFLCERARRGGMRRASAILLKGMPAERQNRLGLWSLRARASGCALVTNRVNQYSIHHYTRCKQACELSRRLGTWQHKQHVLHLRTFFTSAACNAKSATQGRAFPQTPGTLYRPYATDKDTACGIDVNKHSCHRQDTGK